MDKHSAPLALAILTEHSYAHKVKHTKYIYIFFLNICNCKNNIGSCVGGNGFQMKSSVYPFPVWSPGYSSSTITGYGANLKCVWNLKISKEGNSFQVS